MQQLLGEFMCANIDMLDWNWYKINQVDINKYCQISFIIVYVLISLMCSTNFPVPALFNIKIMFLNVAWIWYIKGSIFRDISSKCISSLFQWWPFVWFIFLQIVTSGICICGDFLTCYDGKTVHHILLVGRRILLQWPIHIAFMSLSSCFFCRKKENELYAIVARAYLGLLFLLCLAVYQ